MARYTPLRSSIWTDAEFVALEPRAQLTYFLVMSQADMTFAGVVSFTPARWARMSAKTSVAEVEYGIRLLEAARFVLVDRETEEVMVRTFVKHGKIYEQKQLRQALVRAYESILSTGLRRAWWSEQSDAVKALVGSLPEACPVGVAGASGTKDLDLDLDLHPLPVPGEEAHSPERRQSSDLLRPGAAPSLLEEVEDELRALTFTHGDEVEGAVSTLLDDGVRFRYASEVKAAVLRLLPDAAKRNALDDAQAAQRALAAEGQAAWRAQLEAAEGVIPSDPEARRKFLAAHPLRTKVTCALAKHTPLPRGRG